MFIVQAERVWNCSGAGCHSSKETSVERTQERRHVTDIMMRNLVTAFSMFAVGVIITEAVQFKLESAAPTYADPDAYGQVENHFK